MKLLKNLFYGFYQLMVSVGNKNVAEYYALLLMTMTVGLNIYTTASIIYLITGQRIDLNFNSKPVIIIEFLITNFIFYLLLVRDKKYLGILKMYEIEPDKQKIRRNIIVIFYVLLSVAALFFSVFLMIKKNKGEL